MFCPRCGRAINETANFCGGCGLSKAEIEKFAQQNIAAQPAEETSAQAENAETVYTQTTETEAPKAEEAAYAQTAETAAPVYKTPEPEAPKTETVPPVYSYGNPQNTADTAHSAPAVKNENLTTVDFIWMFIISAIPVVGFIYLIWLAVQNNNTNKRSFARATLIISLFSVLITAVFIIGFVVAGII